MCNTIQHYFKIQKLVNNYIVALSRLSPIYLTAVRRILQGGPFEARSMGFAIMFIRRMT